MTRHRDWPTTAAITLALVMSGAALVKAVRERPSRRLSTPEPTNVADWRGVASGASLLHGLTTAPVSVSVFTDYQCPYCKQFESVVDTIVREFPSRVAVFVRHLPLTSIHPRADDSARLAICADGLGLFRRVHDELFRKQESVGRMSTSELVHAVGFGNDSALMRCMASPAARVRVESDLRLARNLGLRGTPTFLINEKLIVGGVSTLQLRSLVRTALP